MLGANSQTPQEVGHSDSKYCSLLKPPNIRQSSDVCAGESDESASLAAVGTWGMHLHTFRLPDLTPAANESLGSEAIPRSVLLAVFDGAPFLLCALGDGQLYNFHIDVTTGRHLDLI